jgi:hypothetical protein
MRPCDTTGLAKILKIFVHKLQGLSFLQIQSYDEIRRSACTILGQLYFFRIRVLTLYGVPPKFYNTIKVLYTNAETVVMINGEIGESFIAIRGVRQGDPLMPFI